MHLTILITAGLLIPTAALAAPKPAPKSDATSINPTARTPEVLKAVQPKAGLSFNWTSPTRQAVPDVTVDLDLENRRVGDALKQVFEQTKHQYVVDADVPETTRITARVRNVQLHTALELITQAAGVRWGVETRDGKLVFRIGKSVPALSGNSFLFLPERQQIQGAGPVTTFRPIPVPDGFLDFSRHATKLFNNGSMAYRDLTQEERSTFTCPHCQGKSTVITQRQQPKCPKCERIFQSDWQFCPADGTARPPTPGQWQYCPLCGKQVELVKPASSNYRVRERFVGGQELPKP
jgi:hypothetical protein